MNSSLELSEVSPEINWKRGIFLGLGLLLFVLLYLAPPMPDALDPAGTRFPLSHEGKAALAIFLLAGIWWVFEVVPIGVTSLAIGLLQVVFLVRPAEEAFGDFMRPSVLFIFASIVIGQVFTKTGLTQRLAYRMLAVVGDRTSRIYLGCFIITSALTHIMAHTAVAATLFPLLMTIYAHYGEGQKQTRFGKGLFIGMAYVAGAGSIVTLLGAARGAVAIGFFHDITGEAVSFFELSYYMFPLGWLMTFLLWLFFMLFFTPEKEEIPGLQQKAREMCETLGPMTRKEILSGLIIFGCILVMGLQSFIPALSVINKSGIILISTVLFFVFNILDIEDLEEIPWNIILLFAGAMSIGFCLWETGAAKWLAVQWLDLFKESTPFVFILSVAFFVMMMTNFIMNVAAIAISLPVALVLAPYLNVAPEVILFASLAAAGMPFLLLVGAAPNAIAYESKQFSTAEFFLYGIPASVLLMAGIAFMVRILWPLMGMELMLTG
ncbi:MAG TPA: SLC13 family permease [SAR324 cluster bacterium]|nr:SLC13 family permease [SAR324 cluster bacterium]